MKLAPSGVVGMINSVRLLVSMSSSYFHYTRFCYCSLLSLITYSLVSQNALLFCHKSHLIMSDYRYYHPLLSFLPIFQCISLCFQCIVRKGHIKGHTLAVHPTLPRDNHLHYYSLSLLILVPVYILSSSIYSEFQYIF